MIILGLILVVIGAGLGKHAGGGCLAERGADPVDEDDVVNFASGR